ncbi:MAG: uroporphyrinogen-III synthase [Gemmatimonadetes bacterium]|nr:uroporphyrinogen-III synthase [Gemmatimonadota bacterium]
MRPIKPLSGRRVAVTRAPQQAADLCRRLSEVGASVVRCPTIQIDPPDSYGALDAALSDIRDYTMMVITSSNGSRAILQRLDELGIHARELRGLEVAAMGPATAQPLLDRGVRTTICSDAATSELLLERLGSLDGQRVFLPRSDIADNRLVEGLLSRGVAEVNDVEAYRTVPMAPPPQSRKQLELGVDAICFTSPSTVAGLQLMGPDWRGLTSGALVVAIGPTTAAAAKAAGIPDVLQARQRSTSGLVAALIEGLQP